MLIFLLFFVYGIVGVQVSCQVGDISVDVFVKINSDYQEPIQIRITGNILFVVVVALKPGAWCESNISTIPTTLHYSQQVTVEFIIVMNLSLRQKFLHISKKKR